MKNKPAKTPSAERLHPGVFIAEELVARNWTVDDLVNRGRFARYRWETLIGGRRLTMLDAFELSNLFGTGHEFWINLQKIYDGKQT